MLREGPVAPLVVWPRTSGRYVHIAIKTTGTVLEEMELDMMFGPRYGLIATSDLLHIGSSLIEICSSTINTAPWDSLYQLSETSLLLNLDAMKLSTRLAVSIQVLDVRRRR